MKKDISLRVLAVLMNLFPFYCSAEENRLNNFVNLGKEEEKARINMLKHPIRENIDKHKEATKEFLNVIDLFAEEYSKNEKKSTD